MGVCINCKYHQLLEETNELPKHRKFIPVHQCLNPNYQKTDFITGEVTVTNCYEYNTYQECQFFEQIEEEENTPEDGSTIDSDASSDEDDEITPTTPDSSDSEEETSDD